MAEIQIVLGESHDMSAYLRMVPVQGTPNHVYRCLVLLLGNDTVSVWPLGANKVQALGERLIELAEELRKKGYPE